MSQAKDTEESSFSLLSKIIDGLLLLLTLILSVAVFFAIMNILLTITTILVIPKDSITVQQAYIVGAVRNFWVFFGGIFLLAFLIGHSDYHSRRLGEHKTSRILLWTFIIEIILIVIGLII